MIVVWENASLSGSELKQKQNQKSFYTIMVLFLASFLIEVHIVYSRLSKLNKASFGNKRKSL